MLLRTQVIQAYVYHMYRRVINLGIICLTCHLFLPQCFYKFLWSSTILPLVLSPSRHQQVRHFGIC